MSSERTSGPFATPEETVFDAVAQLSPDEMGVVEVHEDYCKVEHADCTCKPAIIVVPASTGVS